MPEHEDQLNALQARLSDKDRELADAQARLRRLDAELDQARSQLLDEARKQQQITAQLNALVLHDELTGIANRRALNLRLDLEVVRSHRYSRPLTLAICDIDGFKGFNDTFGHAAGDQILQMVATLLSRSARATDLVSRWGGDEFAILLTDTSLAQACVALERYRKVIAMTHWEHRPITISVGLAPLELDHPNIDVMFKQADQALYQAKSSGRNRVLPEPETDPAPPRRHHSFKSRQSDGRATFDAPGDER